MHTPEILYLYVENDEALYEYLLVDISPLCSTVNHIFTARERLVFIAPSFFRLVDCTALISAGSLTLQAIDD